MEVQDVQLVSKLSQTEIVTMFVIATLLMWAERVVVKNLYDVAMSDKRAMRA
jgi:hypothetical protein